MFSVLAFTSLSWQQPAGKNQEEITRDAEELANLIRKNMLQFDGVLEETEMVSQKVTIKNPTGLHLRPAGILCKEAMKFQALITFNFKGGTANAKSVLSVLGACIKSGDSIEFVCEGDDEEKALQAVVLAVESGLGES